MDLYSGIDANGNLTTTSYDWHHDDQHNEINAMNATNALNASLAQWQYNKDIEFWKMQNEYNSPSNQLKLLQEAGLNPLFFGNNLTSNSGAGSVSAPNMANASNTYQSQEQAKMANVVNLLNGLGSGAETMLKNKQVALESSRLDLEKQKVDSELKYNASKTAETEASTKSILQSTETNKETQKYIRKQMAEIDTKMKEANERINILRLDHKLYGETFADRVNQFHFGARLQEAGILKTENEAKRINQDWLNSIKEGHILGYEEILKKIEAENEEATRGGDREKGKVYEKLGKIVNAAVDKVLDETGLSYVTDSLSRSTRNPVYPDVWSKDDLSEGGRIGWKNGWKSKWMPY